MRLSAGRIFCSWYHYSMSDGVIEIQVRDIAILHNLFLSRIMTQAHIAALHFSGKSEYAKKRLQHLKAAGYIAQRPRSIKEPAVLYLDRLGFKLLHDHGILSAYPHLSKSALERRAKVSERTECHELAVMDVKAAMVPALQPLFHITEFSTWPLLHQFNVPHPRTRVNTTIQPDGYIRIREGDQCEYSFFFELDRGTEQLQVLYDKAICYLQFYRCGGFAERNGASRSDFGKHPFRVLIVVKTAERRNNLADRLINGNPPIRTQTWITTMDEVLANPLGSIWIRPQDYSIAVQGTSFAKPLPTRFGYQRQSARDAHIEKTIQKHALLDGTKVQNN